MTAKAIMIQGTGSGVGKSILTAGLARIFWKDGRRAAPFKSQNMALNSFVTLENLEMGRAQVMQAEACGLVPTVLMNPILLKPSGDTRSQVVLMGKPLAEYEAIEYYQNRDRLMAKVREAYRSLAEQYDIIVIEGAGSPAEINLRDKDLVNMAMAFEANAPVIIVGDIDRGGVFAWMKGTYDLLNDRERRHVKGFIINKFRGDIRLLEDGVTMFEEMVGLPVLGVVPFDRDLILDEEDAVPLDEVRAVARPDQVDVAVVYLPHISNFTDFSALAREPDVLVRYVLRPEQLGRPDVMIIPGSKNTIEDLNRLRQSGMEKALAIGYEEGVPLVGICGGFQMMGRAIEDPHQVETKEGRAPGIGLLPMTTVMARGKTTVQVSLESAPGDWIDGRYSVSGYEIHMGETLFEEALPPLFDRPGSPSVSLGNRLIGTYVHGLFDEDDFRWAFLKPLRVKKGLAVPASPAFRYRRFKEEQFDRLETLVRRSVDMEAIYAMVEKGI